jgi:hypothetical protein
MALPKYTFPIYTLQVPSSGKDLKYRPFLVKDEKNLLLSQQSEEEVSMYDTLKTVIASCIVEGPKVDDLSVFDIEYIFTQLRCKSIGEQVELVFTCQNEKCGEKESFSFNIDPEIKKNPEHTNKIELFEDVGVIMKYPGTEQMKKISTLDFNDPDAIIEMIASHVDCVYDNDQVYNSATKKETIQFIENLPRDASDKIKKFFETMPKLSQKVEYECKHCGEKHDYLVEGIQNFF